MLVVETIAKIRRAFFRQGKPIKAAEMNAALANHGAKPAVSLERHAFYAAAETAYAIVQTGERRFYGNILLTKGVVPPEKHG